MAIKDQKTRAILKINGNRLDIWKTISVQMSVTQIAGQFSFSTSNRFAGENEKWGIATGDKFELEIAGQTLMTGFLDDVDDGYEAGSHTITFSGRDKTADLVDCPFDVFTAGFSQINNQTVLQIITKLCKPFGINVVVNDLSLKAELNTEKIAVYDIELGDMVYSQIAVLCRQYAVLPIPSGDGNLALTRSGLSSTHDKLESGVNILANRLIQSDKDRFSIYYATGGAKQDAFSKKLNVEGTYRDNNIKRFRPTITLVGAQAGSDGLCQKRAQWEAKIRVGASRKVQTRVKGWTQSNGDIWSMNTIVPIKDRKIGVLGLFLIAGVTLNLDDKGGELCTIMSVPPDTFAINKTTSISNKKITAFEHLRK